MTARIRLAWRLLVGRRGLAVLALACIAIGVAARGAVTGTVAAFEAHLAREARSLIAADLEVSSARPLESAVRESLAAVLPPGSRTAELRTLTAMAAGGGQAVMVELAAIGEGWPLVGALGGEPVASVIDLGRSPQAALVDPDLLPRLKLQVGDELVLGRGHFRIVGSIVSEPGNGGSAFRLGPKVYVPLAALGPAGLGDPGIRARFHLLATVPDPADALAVATALRHRLKLSEAPLEIMGPGPAGDQVSVRTAGEAAQTAARAIARGADFLRLVALFALGLGAIGVAALARAMMLTQAEDLAVLRVLGADRTSVAGVFLLQAVGLGLAGGLLGTGLGAGLATGATLAMGLAPAWPLTIDLALGLVLGIAAALVSTLVPTLTLARMAPLAVLRGEAPAAIPWVTTALILAATLGTTLILAAVEVRSWLIGPSIAAGAFILAGGLALAGGLLLPVIARLKPPSFALRQGWANLSRSGGTLLVALGLAAALGSALLTLRGSILAELAPDRLTQLPGFFVLDVQDDQQAAFTAFLGERGLVPNLRPLVRARLQAIDGVETKAAGEAVALRSREAERRAFFHRREQNLTWAVAPGPGEHLIAGRWPQAATECAVETRWADQVGVRLGSRLRFDVQGVEIELTITGLRRIDWLTFQPNMFITCAPAALSGAPAVWIGTIPTMATPLRQTFTADLARRFPNITAIDIGDATVKARALVARLSAGIAAVAVVALLAGLAVVAGTAAAMARARRQESALIRALGGTRRTVALALAVEFGTATIVAAVLGSAAGLVGGLLLTTSQMQVSLTIPWLEVTALILVLSSTATGTALITTRSAWHVPPLAVLREE